MLRLITLIDLHIHQSANKQILQSNTRFTVAYYEITKGCVRKKVDLVPLACEDELRGVQLGCLHVS